MNIKFIELSRGKYAIVDEEHFERLANHRWHVDDSGYARRATTMHENVIGLSPNKMVIDHINGDRSDNRKCNLRFATKSQNNLNIRVKSNNTSGTTGVVWIKCRSRWQAFIMVNGKKKFLGNFKDKEDAVKARFEAERIYYKEFSSYVCRGME